MCFCPISQLYEEHMVDWMCPVVGRRRLLKKSCDAGWIPNNHLQDRSVAESQLLCMLAGARLILEASSLASPNDLIAKMMLSAELIAAFWSRSI